MRIFITGGAGFIGSHLAEAYLRQGDDVYALDDLSTGSLDNIKHLQSHPKFRNRFYFSRGSILNRDEMLDYVGICDVVFHLAAAVGVQYIIQNPLSSIITNVRGTENILELCAKFKKKVVVASTSEVYGKHDHSPLRESDDSVYGPSEKSRWSYAAAKLMDEFTSLAYHRTVNLPVIIARLFNTVGPRQTGRYGMVIPRFVRQALLHEPITVFGNGKQTRTFTHVAEVVISLMKLVGSPKSLGQVINIGGIEEVTILELANRIKKLTKSRSKVMLIPYEKAYPKDFEDMQRRVPCTKKLKALTNYAPEMGLNQILHDVVGYFQSKWEDKTDPLNVDAVNSIIPRLSDERPSSIASL